MMFRWLLRPVVARTGLYTSPLIWLLVALVLESLWHQQAYRVARPQRDLDPPFAVGCGDPAAAARQPRENATFVMLARNSEVADAKATVDRIERSFNRWFHYPILFLNDEAWDPDAVAALNGSCSGASTFDVIPRADWTFPDSIDVDEARRAMKAQDDAGIYQGGREGYHHMCRFYSGKFYTLSALEKYRWYWRLEPNVDFPCSLTYDPFVEMARADKAYGYTIALWEGPKTVPGLFRAVSDYKEMKKLPTTEMWKTAVMPSWLPWPLRKLAGRLGWRLRDAHGDRWNLCHYWSNFEIGDMDFFRGKAYQDLFEYLDRTGGFYMERWGDAPVHTLAAQLLLPAERLHHFADLGYTHEPFYQCPINAAGGQLPDNEALGHDQKWFTEEDGGIGCRCRCDSGPPRNDDGYCLGRFAAPVTKEPPSFWTWFKGWWLYSSNPNY